MSWHCNCGVLNSGVNTRCSALKHYRSVEHYQVTQNTFDSLMALCAGYELRKELKQIMTENEDKFASFFNAEITLISAMTEAERIDHIQELESIAFEAKARLTAAKSHQRDSAATKRAGGEWSVTPTNPDQTVTDTINRVKLRGKRMTKLDSTRASLEKLGLSRAEIEAMMSGMMKAAANSADAKSTQIERDAKKDSEPKANGSVKELATPQLKPIATVVIDVEPSKPLDLSKLKFS